MNNLEPQFKEFADLTIKEIDKAARTALNKAANTLKKNTQRTLANALPAALTSGKYPDALVAGVMRSKYDKNNSMVKVHVMGTRTTGSGTFRLRFFEGGTKERITKKGYKRGHITALRFFESATNSTDVNGIIEEALNTAIDKINSKK